VRVLVTGASGFAGQWLVRELTASGHEAVGAPRSSSLDITDAAAVRELLRSTAPDAVAHLAGLAFGPDARRDPDRATAVNAGGARNVLEAAGEIPILVVSSAEVYGAPSASDLPLRETAPLAADQPYGRSKVALERAVADIGSARVGRRAIVRPFNHIGPGQRAEFVVPAVARRILEARDRGDSTIAAGNVDVRRDFSDVRDVVRAYRLVLEALAGTAPSADPMLYNIASGSSVAIRAIIGMLASFAGVAIDIDVDPSLVRAADPPEIRGDATRLSVDLGWHPTIPLETSLRDVLEDVQRASTGTD
jgi:GDP-4-dehydro-6-deoxy-D-mannose reductase